MKRFSITIDPKLYPDLVTWLEKQPNASAAIRDTLNDCLFNQTDDPGLDLAAIRAVIEAVLDEKLNGIALATGQIPQTPQPDREQNDPFADLLKG